MSKPTPHQSKRLDALLDWAKKPAEPYAILNGSAGCVDKNTEFLTPNGWKFIDEYQDGDLVCQWKDNGETDFISPEEYIKVPADKMYHMISKTIDMVLSGGHRFPYITSRNKFNVKSFEDIMKMSTVKIPRYFNAPKNDGINLSDEYIRVLIMQSADGNLISNREGFVSINVKKNRKIERVKKLLNDACVEYKTVKSGVGYIRFNYKSPSEIYTKNLNILWQCSPRQLEIIVDECFNWDGSISNVNGKPRYSFVGNKTNCDLIQYAVSSTTGKYCSLYKDKRKYKNGDIYYLNTTNRYSSVITFKDKRQNRVINIKEFETLDGYQYCFKTPSSFWLARRNGKIFPTGNTGKTYLAKEFIYKVDKKTIMSATTHQACKVLADSTGEESVPTIHSLLSLKPKRKGKEFVLEKNTFRKNPSLIETYNPRIVLIDEGSMLNQEVLNFIDEDVQENNRKYLVLADWYQTPPVGERYSKVFDLCEPNTLREIVRQQKGSPIITLATQIRDMIDDGKPNSNYLHEMHNKQGSVGTYDAEEFLENIYNHDFINSEDKTRILCWTNEQVHIYNEIVNSSYGIDGVPFVAGSTVIFNEPVIRKDEVIVNNSHIGICTSIRKRDQLNSYPIYEVTIDNLEDEVFYVVPLEHLNDHKDRLSDLVAHAYSDKSKWYKYYEYVEKFSDIRQPFASTIHKAQGSTYYETYLDGDDLRKNKNIEERMRLAYTGVTRSSHKVKLLGELF